MGSRGWSRAKFRVADADGIVAYQSQFNDNGDIVSLNFLDAVGRPGRTRAGYSKIEFSYDAFGNRTRTATFDIDGKPFVAADGFAETRQSYDKWGNPELLTFFDATGLPTRTKSGEFKIRRKSDERGWLREEAYLDENDKPVLSTDGWAMYRYEYDSESNIVRVRFFDARGALLAQIVKTYKDGLLVREVYLDTLDRPLTLASGNSGVTMSYRNGLEVERVFLDSGSFGLMKPSPQGDRRLRNAGCGSLVPKALSADRCRTQTDLRRMRKSRFLRTLVLPGRLTGRVGGWR
jgi:hypothetical protein